MIFNINIGTINKLLILLLVRHVGRVRNIRGSGSVLYPEGGPLPSVGEHRGLHVPGETETRQRQWLARAAAGPLHAAAGGLGLQRITVGVNNVRLQGLLSCIYF